MVQNPLADKRIVLDPGHGFGVTGAIGHAGTREVDINIRVTRILADLLRNAGATVYITWDEMDHEDLARRVQISVSKQPDLFLSIHHNATAPPDPARNRIEVYYPFDGGAAVQDLAQNIAFALKTYSGLPVHPPLPARYRVLKGNVPLSILVEPGYVSHRDMERRLRDPEYQAGEARALYEGIRQFFAMVPPEIEQVSVHPATRTFEITVQAHHSRVWITFHGPKGTWSQSVPTGRRTSVQIPEDLWQAGTWLLQVREPGARTAECSVEATDSPALRENNATHTEAPSFQKRLLILCLSWNPIFEEVGGWVRESLTPLGIDVQVWPARGLPRDEVALLRKAEALKPDLILLLDTQFRWPEGWYFYYRDVRSREVGEILAKTASFYGIPDRIREGSTYFLIQGRPGRVLFNGYVPALPLASTLIAGVVEAWFGEQPIQGTDAPSHACVQAEEGYFVFATAEGAYRLPYSAGTTAQVEGG